MARGHSIRRRMGQVFLAVLAGGMGMIISFGMVRYVTRDLSLVPRIDEASLAQAQWLRGYSNRLIDLGLIYLDRYPLAEALPPPGFQAWIQSTFSPDALALHSDIEAGQKKSPIPNTGDFSPWRDLLSALDRLTVMAGHPEDQALREAALRDVRHAAQRVEEYIAFLKMDKYVREPSHLPWIPDLP